MATGPPSRRGAVMVRPLGRTSTTAACWVRPRGARRPVVVRCGSAAGRALTRGWCPLSRRRQHPPGHAGRHASGRPEHPSPLLAALCCGRSDRGPHGPWGALASRWPSPGAGDRTRPTIRPKPRGFGRGEATSGPPGGARTWWSSPPPRRPDRPGPVCQSGALGRCARGLGPGKAPLAHRSRPVSPPGPAGGIPASASRPCRGNAGARAGSTPHGCGGAIAETSPWCSGHGGGTRGRNSRRSS